jgi:hypothetical protein
MSSNWVAGKRSGWDGGERKQRTHGIIRIKKKKHSRHLSGRLASGFLWLGSAGFVLPHKPGLQFALDDTRSTDAARFIDLMLDGGNDGQRPDSSQYESQAEEEKAAEQSLSKRAIQ